MPSTVDFNPLIRASELRKQREIRAQEFNAQQTFASEQAQLKRDTADRTRAEDLAIKGIIPPNIEQNDPAFFQHLDSFRTQGSERAKADDLRVRREQRLNEAMTLLGELGAADGGGNPASATDKEAFRRGFDALIAASEPEDRERIGRTVRRRVDFTSQQRRREREEEERGFIAAEKRATRAELARLRAKNLDPVEQAKRETELRKSKRSELIQGMGLVEIPNLGMFRVVENPDDPKKPGFEKLTKAEFNEVNRKVDLFVGAAFSKGRKATPEDILRVRGALQAGINRGTIPDPGEDDEAARELLEEALIELGLDPPERL